MSSKKRIPGKRKDGIDLGKDNTKALVPLKDPMKKKRPKDKSKAKPTDKSITVTAEGKLQLAMLATQPTYTITVTLDGTNKVLQKSTEKNRKYPEFDKMMQANLTAITTIPYKRYKDTSKLYVMFLRHMIHQKLTKDAAKGLKLKDPSFYNKIKEKGITYKFEMSGKEISLTTPPTGRTGSRFQDELSAEQILGESLFLGLKF